VLTEGTVVIINWLIMLFYVLSQQCTNIVSFSAVEYE